MPNIHAIEFVYANGEKLTVTDKSFKEAIKLVLNGTFDPVGTPLKVKFPNTGKVLHFDDDHFRNYNQGNLDQPEIIELTQCDGLYRNNQDMQRKNGIAIDAQSLWKKQGGYMILVDGDYYIECPQELAEFTEI